MKYEDNHNNEQNNLNGEGDLIVLNNNRFAMIFRVIGNTSCCNLNNGDMLREVTVKTGLERINMQEGVTVEALLDSRATELVISLEFVRKQGFKLRKIKRPIYMRNVDRTLNEKRPIEHMMEVNIYYWRHRKRIEIDMIEE